MPKKRYAIDRGGPRRLQIAWENRWRNMTIHFDEQLVAAIPTRQELKAGRKLVLPDGSTLWVQLVKKTIDTELHVLRNDRPVPGSYTDPAARFKLAYGIALAVTGAYLILGALVLLARNSFVQYLSVNASAVIIGALLAILTIFIKRRSEAALGALTAIILLDALLSAFISVVAGRFPGILGLVISVTLAFPLLDGLEALRELKAQEAMDEEEQDGAWG